MQEEEATSLYQGMGFGRYAHFQQSQLLLNTDKKAELDKYSYETKVSV